MEVSKAARRSPVVGRIVAGGMLREGTPIEDYREDYGLLVKREDRSCLPPGPPFSKARGVYAHVLSRPEAVIGVLDTYHSQAGHAVARACQVLGKRCVNFYPDFKNERGPREPQRRAEAIGAELYPIPAGRSSIIYHAAKKETLSRGGYMMPNALKLEESVRETARECPPVGRFSAVLIPASSGTIAAGVVRGLEGRADEFLIHLGYTRSHEEVEKYIVASSGVRNVRLRIVDEDYQYKDTAEAGPTPPWPCNPYYDLKTFRWWVRTGWGEHVDRHGEGPSVPPVLFWNIG